MKCIFFFIVLIATGIPTRAQSPPFANSPLPHPPLSNPTLSNPSLEEKIFVHTDKDFYLAGEILWLKLYIVDAAFHRPLDLSKLAYVEILSPEQRPVLQARIPLTDGLGNGSFHLPFSIHSGNYILRAYTNWMKNAGPEAFYEKTITIFNSLRNTDPKDSLSTLTNVTPATAPTATTSPDYDIQFFPEGGNLVKGLPSRVAFRIADRSGKGVPSKGFILGQAGDTLARFQTLLFGMGQFNFTPSATDPYRAVLEPEDHPLVTRDLPPAEEKGYTLEMTDAGDGRLFVSVRTPVPVPKEDSIVRMLVHTRHSMTRLDKENISTGEARFTIEKTMLDDGINIFTILNAKSTPVAERLWFNYPDRLNIDLHADKETYTPREKVTLTVSIRDTAGSPARFNGSMAVVLQDSLQSTGYEDILNYLLLSSDIRGTIESPAYYFSGNTPEVRAGMDLLMRVQGFRRFQQPTAAAYSYPPEYAGLLVTGRITNRITGAPAAGIPAWLSAPGPYFHLGYSVSNDNGELQWNLGMLYGAHELVMLTNDPLTDSLYRIELSPSFTDPLIRRDLQPFRLPAVSRDLLLRHSIAAQALNAYQSDKRQHFLQPLFTDTTNFFGRPDKRYLLDDYTRFTTMEEVMREYVREVKVRSSKGKFSFYVQSDQANQIFFESLPLTLVDGVPVSDFNNIIRFDPLKIRKLDIMTKRYLLNDSLFTGIISYTTYEGNLSGFPVDKNATIEEYDGLQYQREFYSPVYETRDQQDSRIPDLRNVLYWSPEILTDRDGRQQLSFYTSDVPGRYTVLLQGITNGGKIGSARTSFTIAPTVIHSTP
jgi:hypothetical protein